MQWNIPDIPEIPKPQKYKWNTLPIWLMVLVFLYLIITPTLWLMWGNTAHSVWFWGIVFFLPLLICALARFLVFSWEMNNEQRFLAWEKEKNNIRQRWGTWAQKRIAILASGFCLPEGLSREALITKKQDIPAIFARKEGTTDTELNIYALFVSDIFKLIESTGHNHIMVYLTGNASYDQEVQVSKIKTAASDLGEDCARWTFASIDNSLNKINDWFKKRPEGLQIVFSVAMNHEDSMLFTENACWVAFTSSEEISQFNWEVKWWFQRPTNIDFSNIENADKAVRHFTEFGLANRKIDTLWNAGLNSKDILELRKLFGQTLYNQYFASNFTECMASNNLCGTPPNIAWLILALMIDSSASQKEQLLAWQKEGNIFLGGLQVNTILYNE